MDLGSADPQHDPERPAVDRRAGRGQGEHVDEQPSRHEHVDGQSESYGPLEIERHSKRDGRALILYAWHGHERA